MRIKHTTTSKKKLGAPLKDWWSTTDSKGRTHAKEQMQKNDNAEPLIALMNPMGGL